MSHTQKKDQMAVFYKKKTVWIVTTGFVEAKKTLLACTILLVNFLKKRRLSMPDNARYALHSKSNTPV